MDFFFPICPPLCKNLVIAILLKNYGIAALMMKLRPGVSPPQLYCLALIINIFGCQSASPKELASETSLVQTSTGPKEVDEACFLEYSHAADRCNSDFAIDNRAFHKCLEPVKGGLASCCKERGGSSKCLDAAHKADMKKVDDECFAAYGYSAAECNVESDGDEHGFGKCLGPVKQRLKDCCKSKGGSVNCAEDAASAQ